MCPAWGHPIVPLQDHGIPHGGCRSTHVMQLAILSFCKKKLYNEMCKVFKQGANARWIIQWKYYNLIDLKTEQTLFHTLAHSIGLSQMNELKKWWTKQRCPSFSLWSVYEILVCSYRRMDPWQLHIALVDVLAISASTNISLICLSKITIQNRGAENGTLLCWFFWGFIFVLHAECTYILPLLLPK